MKLVPASTVVKIGSISIQQFDGRWNAVDDAGKTVATGTLQVDLAAGKSSVVWFKPE